MHAGRSPEEKYLAGEEVGSFWSATKKFFRGEKSNLVRIIVRRQGNEYVGTIEQRVKRGLITAPRHSFKKEWETTKILRGTTPEQVRDQAIAYSQDQKLKVDYAKILS